MCALSIGSLSRQTGASVATIRYYESIGIMPEPNRGLGGQRQFGAADLARLRFINSRRALGYSLAAIRDLLREAGPQAQSCNAARAAAEQQLAVVRHKLAELSQIEAQLIDQINTCATDCGPQVDPACTLVQSRPGAPQL